MPSYKNVTMILSILLAGSTNAFHLPSSSSQTLSSRITSLQMSDTEMSEVDKLRAAAAKAREEYERLSKEAGKEVISSNTSSSQSAPTKSHTLPELQSLSVTIDFASGDAATQASALDRLVDSGDFTAWKSAIRRTNSVTTSSSMKSALVPFPVTLQSLESRTGGKVTGVSLGIGGEGDVKFEDFQDLTIAVVLGSTGLGIASLALLPENVGATLTYLFALIPVGFIGVGSVAPGLIAEVIQGSREESDDDITRKERICRHEAGHFLCGYLCGLPVKSYEINADTGAACVEFHMDGSEAGGKLSEDEIAALSVVAMSGSVAEILSYEKARGGENDLLQLQDCFRRGKDFIGAAKQQDLTRWGALTAYTLIKGNMGKYEKLVDAFKAKKKLADCVAIIECSS